MAETSWTATKTGLLVPERRTIAVDLSLTPEASASDFTAPAGHVGRRLARPPTMISSVPARRGPRFIDP